MQPNGWRLSPPVCTSKRRVFSTFSMIQGLITILSDTLMTFPHSLVLPGLTLQQDQRMGEGQAPSSAMGLSKSEVAAIGLLG
jgi:hypothetical protein